MKINFDFKKFNFLMKKLLVLFAVLVASATAASAQTWGIGGRLGSGFQAVGQYVLPSENYVEARFGMDYIGGLAVDFSVLYNWNIANMNWTPKGNWFFDAGAGLRLGGAAHVARVGVQGVAKLGYTFEFPLSLSFDFSPSFGPVMIYGRGFRTGDTTKTETLAGFDVWAIPSFGISAVYRF